MTYDLYWSAAHVEGSLIMSTWPNRTGRLAVRLYLLPVMIVGVLIVIAFGAGALALLADVLARLVH